MKRNNRIIAIIAVCMALLPPACKKSFLSQTDTAAATASATFQKPQQVVALVNAIYDTYQSSDLLKKSMWYYANFMTHDWYNWGTDYIWNNYGIGADFYAIPTFWNNAYIGIARANSALEVIAATRANGVLPAALADRLEGEAYFLRGMTYYYLAGTFGAVPLELKAETNGLSRRIGQDTVFKQVIADMQLAEGLLLSKTQLAATDIGRATKGAAYAYEGAAHMWLKDYAGALTAFNNTELTTNYHLLPQFVNVGEFDHQNNDESIYEVQFNVYGSQSWDGGWQDGGEEGWIDDFSWPWEISGFGYDYGNPGLWYSYQAGDLRRNLTIVGPGDTLQSPGILAKWGGIKGYAVTISNFAEASKVIAGPDSPAILLARQRYTTGINNIHTPANTNAIINTCGSVNYPWYGDDGGRSGYYNAKKWRDPTLTGANGTSAIFGGQNQILMRYAEVLLSRAECKIRTGDVNGGLADIKLVRDRAWGGSAPATMQDGLTWDGKPTQPITDPLQMVYSEYRHELTAEYSEFYDLRRAGVAQAFVQAAYGTTSNTNPILYPFGPTADGKTHGVYMTSLPNNKDVLPIPVTAIALNPNLTQNPSY
ncbi:MAG: RagB/SusD family nutrient uptake outer membrane protein [Bacteroidota bacterium]|nr:RagB/SusD family nutrient uptake outer membrane protein [Bacteroidota bacterium]MDP4246017.1 RagB/SusD family nutrient uptake outer membrane protein [Bacteroidota bacterium]MDP4252566.1 RagB/SusD family nutrient uptake outer membrane protein [Bacteroidota bacterium]MDP4257798.1 RagB/SusD family nutrient uptake outer membrane protein [Bacteroidota bacterium]